MKKNKFLFPLVMLISTLIFSGCPESKKSASIDEVYAKMESTVELPCEMMKMDDNDFINQFGFNLEDFDRYIFAQGKNTLLAETIVLIKAKDGIDMNQIKGKLEGFASDLEIMFNGYIPEQGQVAGKRVIAVKGNYAYLLMSSKVSELKKIAQEMI